MATTPMKSTAAAQSAASAQRAKLVTELQKSGAVNFDRLGDLVAKVGPQVFDPSQGAENSVVSVGDAILRVYKLDKVEAIQSVADLKKVAPALMAPTRARISIPTAKK